MKGITVILYEKTQIGVDELNKPIYEETPTQIENVLVAPVSSQEAQEITDLTGKQVSYNLAIPKGDMHVWEDRKVEFFGAVWHTVGFSTEGIEHLIPLSWNKKVMVERYG